MSPPSEYERETRKQVDGLDTKIDGIVEALHELDIKFIKAVNHLSNRLPYWAVIIIGLLTASIGWLIKFAT